MCTTPSRCLADISRRTQIFRVLRRTKSLRTSTFSWSRTGGRPTESASYFGSMHVTSFNPKTTLTIVQGGPGCSSFDGLMMEVGPWRWDGKSENDFFVKQGGWEEYATVVYGESSFGLSLHFQTLSRSRSAGRNRIFIYQLGQVCPHHRRCKSMCIVKATPTHPASARPSNSSSSSSKTFTKSFRSTNTLMYVELSSFWTPLRSRRPILLGKALLANGYLTLVSPFFLCTDLQLI